MGEACNEGEALGIVGAHIPLSSCSVQAKSCGGPMEREATLSLGSGPSKPFPPIDFRSSVGSVAHEAFNRKWAKGSLKFNPLVVGRSLLL